MKREDTKGNSDRAALKIIRQIPEDEYNRDVEIEARESGVWIDDYIVIPWDWILRTRDALNLPEPDSEGTLSCARSYDVVSGTQT